MWFFAIDVDDEKQLAHDLEPYPANLVLKDGKPLHIDKHLIVYTEDKQPGFIRFILENVLGYEVADSAPDLIYS